MTEETRLDMWAGRWESNNTPWHKQHFNENLLRYWPVVSGGRENLRVLVPLSGKSRDLGWFYRQGHSVVGVEGVRGAVDILFTNEDLEYTVAKVPEHDGWVYQSIDKRFTVYVADFLKVQAAIIGTFDVVFDRGSLEAIEYSDRAGYVEIIKSVLNADFNYHLSGFDYDPAAKTGPPRPLPLDVVKDLFKGLHVKLLGTAECPAEAERFKVETICQNTYHITRQ